MIENSFDNDTIIVSASGDGTEDWIESVDCPVPRLRRGVMVSCIYSLLDKLCVYDFSMADVGCWYVKETFGKKSFRNETKDQSVCKDQYIVCNIDACGNFETSMYVIWVIKFQLSLRNTISMPRKKKHKYF